MAEPSVWLRPRDTDNTSGVCYGQTFLHIERHDLTHT